MQQPIDTTLFSPEVLIAAPVISAVLTCIVILAREYFAAQRERAQAKALLELATAMAKIETEASLVVAGLQTLAQQNGVLVATQNAIVAQSERQVLALDACTDALQMLVKQSERLETEVRIVKHRTGNLLMGIREIGHQTGARIPDVVDEPSKPGDPS